MKNILKEKAIKLRKQGLTYTEILRRIYVAKSTLSVWLRNVKLDERVAKELLFKRLNAHLLGANAKRRYRIEKVRRIKDNACRQIGVITNRELWLMGIMLYWAEGNKESDNNISQKFSFNNSDSEMIKVILKWLNNCLDVQNEDIYIEIYVNELFSDRKRDLIEYWSQVTGFPESKLNKIYFTKNRECRLKKNKSRNYKGLLRVNVKRSTDLNRKISGWVEGVYLNKIIN